MPYRSASYYVPTDYSRVDPRGSFFGNIFRAIGHVATGAIGGFIRGGPIGGIVGAIGGTIAGTQANIASDRADLGGADPTATPGGTSAGTPRAGLRPGMGIIPVPGAPQLASGGPGIGITTVSPLGTPVSPEAIQRQLAGLRHRGQHLNKSWSYRRKTGQLIPPHSTLVSNRRMNWANGRALSRASHRINAFVKHATRFIRWVHPHKRGRAVPRFRKSRSR